MDHTEVYFRIRNIIPYYMDNRFSVVLDSLMIDLCFVAKIQFEERGYLCKKQKDMKQVVRNSIRIVGVPIIRLEIMGKEYCFVVDSGASVNLISSSLKQIVEPELTSIGSFETSVIGGTTVKDSVYILPYSIDGEQYTAEFGFVSEKTFEGFEESGIKVCGIIGTPFMCKHRIIVDFCQGIAYTYGSDSSFGGIESVEKPAA